jgi:hypothetical protein
VTKTQTAPRSTPFVRFALFTVVFAVCGSAFGTTVTWVVLRHLPPPPPPEVEVFDVRARALQIAHDSPNDASLTDWYYDGQTGSAHLHILGKSITCDLHLHEQTVEATVPVTGQPVVTQLFGSGEAISRKQGQYAEGTLIVSAPLCAHEWVNTSKMEDQSNLVFTLGTRFPGNLFVNASDPRILQSPVPTVVDIDAELRQFRDSADRARTIDVPVKEGTLSVRLFKDTTTLATEGHRATLVYAARGSGKIEGLREPVRLAPSVLAVLHVQRPVVVRADEGNPLAIYVVQYLP